jgi:hypothetical protein
MNFPTDPLFSNLPRSWLLSNGAISWAPFKSSGTFRRRTGDPPFFGGGKKGSLIWKHMETYGTGVPNKNKNGENSYYPPIIVCLEVDLIMVNYRVNDGNIWKHD